eukprot:4820086-Lingulodinium_polyedra.AAC.1
MQPGGPHNQVTPSTGLHQAPHWPWDQKAGHRLASLLVARHAPLCQCGSNRGFAVQDDLANVGQ